MRPWVSFTTDQILRSSRPFCFHPAYKLRTEVAYLEERARRYAACKLAWGACATNSRGLGHRQPRKRHNRTIHGGGGGGGGRDDGGGGRVGGGSEGVGGAGGGGVGGGGEHSGGGAASSNDEDASQQATTKQVWAQRLREIFSARE